jgi:DNA-binding transcriptional MerR regulator
LPGNRPVQEGGTRVLTIGEFARASRLSAKALRLYDELGLLRPARVDPDSGYRFYEPAQLERARLVAWLRRLGMPLARIRVVCDAATPDEAGAEVAAFWAQAETGLASRRELAAFLVSHLSRKDTAMPAPDTGLTIRYAAASDTGRTRPVNQDSAYASARLLAVADGTGSAGDRASAAAIEALKPLAAPAAGPRGSAQRAGPGGRAGGRGGAGHRRRRSVARQRDHADRDAVVWVPAGPGACRGHPRLPAA